MASAVGWYWRLAAFLPAVLGLVASSFSQQPNDLTRARGADAALRAYWSFDLVVLLNEPHVRLALKLSAEQTLQQDKLANAYLQSQKELFLAATATQTLPEARRQAALELLARQQHQRAQEYGVRATALLTPAQSTRLEQVTFQLRGVDAFFSPEIDKSLAINEGQRKEIDGVRTWLIQEIRRLCQAGTLPVRGSQVDPAQLTLLRQQAQTRITALLRPDQLERLRQLRGEPIAFTADNLSMLLRESGERRGADVKSP